jgi:tetratricopeptide (TPR) repeat protein/predicted Ser/Thr protein kinase
MAGEPLDDLTVSATRPVEADRHQPLAAGTAIRRYVVLERIGEGGMGVVYSAYDHGLDRRIALKLVRDPTSSVRRQRLLREGQALAKLSHPNVVAVYDVGTFNDQVFVAMELVEGQTVRDWLDESPRSEREILAVFDSAGEALIAAHAAGLVHRDFKPDNVLIDDQGRVRVGDFGLALIAGQEAGQDGDADREALASGPPATLTRTGAAVGTPAYMAPEQHARSAVGAEADQFSFCVALWEALGGSRPFRGDTPVELAAEMVAGRLQEPARAIRPWLRRSLSRGLEVDPGRRYPSMAALVAALKRPRAVRRRWLSAAVAALAIGGLGLVALGGGSRDRPCRDSSRKLASVWDPARADQVSRAFGADASLASVRRSLDDRARAWTDMHRQACEATRISGEQSEAMLDLRMECLDRRRDEMRALVDLLAAADRDTVLSALPAVEALPAIDSCGNAAALREVIPPPDPATAAEARRLRERHAAINALLLTGHARTALEQARGLAADAARLGYKPVEAEALVLVATGLRASGEMAAAEETLYQALAAAEAGRANELVVDAWLELAWVVGEEQARYRDAHRLIQLARGALARLGPNPRLEATLEDGVGVLYLDEGKLDLARRHLERGLALSEKLYGPNHTDVAANLQHLALLEQAEGNHDEAIAMHRRARTITEKELGPEHPNMLSLLGGEGGALYEADRLDEAALVLERGLALAEKTGAGSSPFTASLLANVGSVYRDQKRYAESRDANQRAVEIMSATFGDHPHTATALYNLGLALRDLGDHPAAIERLERAVAMREKIGGDPLELASDLQALASVQERAGRLPLAIRALERSLSIVEGGQPSAKQKADARFKLARALGLAGRDRARARRLADQALAGYNEAGTDKRAAEVAAWLSSR